MTSEKLAALDHRLWSFLSDLVAPMGRSERRYWAKTCVQGLLLDGERKSIEPMAARIAGADVQALRQFVGQSPWSVEAVQEPLARKVVDLFSEPEVWIIDETSFPKAGDCSVGVARQYCGALGKIANCQVAVSLHYSTSELSCPVAWRLYLPREWVEDPEKRLLGRIPEEVVYQSKNELALGLIDQALQWGVPPLPVVADSAYGNDFDFREALRQRGLEYVLAVEPSTKVWLKDPKEVPLPPSKSRGRPRRFAPPSVFPEPKDLLSVARELPATAWKTLTWRMGTKGPMRSRFARVKVWAAHGWKAQAHPERVGEWLLIEWPEGADAPSDYWFGWPAERPVSLRRLVCMAHSRYRVELDYRELKEELGLDHYEGRHWMGWHHHVTLVSMAYAFLRAEQVRAKKKSGWWADEDPAAGQEAAPGIVD